MPRSVVVQRVLGLVFAAVFAVGALWAFGRTPAPGPSAAGPPAGSATGPPSSVGASDPTSGSTLTGPGPATTTSGTAPVATSGPGLTEPGVHVVAQAGADGGLEVLEQVRLPTTATSLAIALPRASASGVAAATPTISGFQAQAGGQVVTDTLASPLPDGGDRLELPAPATEITMRYRLEGGAERSQPAPVGRALVLLPPVTAAEASLSGLPVVVEVVGGSVRNLVCPDLAAAEQLCGRQQGSRWTTPSIPLGRSVVIAQVDLPPPGQQ
jgi:hypothetical protein